MLPATVEQLARERQSDYRNEAANRAAAGAPRGGATRVGSAAPSLIALARRWFGPALSGHPVNARTSPRPVLALRMACAWRGWGVRHRDESR